MSPMKKAFCWLTLPFAFLWLVLTIYLFVQDLHTWFTSESTTSFVLEAVALLMVANIPTAIIIFLAYRWYDGH